MSSLQRKTILATFSRFIETALLSNNTINWTLLRHWCRLRVVNAGPSSFIIKSDAGKIANENFFIAFEDVFMQKLKIICFYCYNYSNNISMIHSLMGKKHSFMKKYQNLLFSFIAWIGMKLVDSKSREATIKSCLFNCFFFRETSGRLLVGSRLLDLCQAAARG